jgi:hypothetical protein
MCRQSWGENVGVRGNNEIGEYVRGLPPLGRQNDDIDIVVEGSG